MITLYFYMLCLSNEPSLNQVCKNNWCWHQQRSNFAECLVPLCRGNYVFSLYSPGLRRTGYEISVNSRKPLSILCIIRKISAQKPLNFWRAGLTRPKVMWEKNRESTMKPNLSASSVQSSCSKGSISAVCQLCLVCMEVTAFLMQCKRR